MRDAYHEDLDSITDELVEMSRLVGLDDAAGPRPRCWTPTASWPRA